MSTVPWRTDTVLALCRGMREVRDYSAAPILADALEDGGHPEDRDLAALRDPATTPVDLERLVALVYSDETASAVGRLTVLAALIGARAEDVDRHFPFGYVSLMEGIEAHLADPDGYELITLPFHEPDVCVTDLGTIWDSYTKVTGRPVPETHRENLFTCAC